MRVNLSCHANTYLTPQWNMSVHFVQEVRSLKILHWWTTTWEITQPNYAFWPPWDPAVFCAPFSSSKRWGSFPQAGHSNISFSVSTDFAPYFLAASIGSWAAMLDLRFIRCMAWGYIKECHKLIKLKPMIRHTLTLQLDTTFRRKFASTFYVSFYIANTFRNCGF